MNEPANLAVRDYWDIIVRGKWIITATILVCISVAGVLCFVLPESYRSSTLILVEDQKIPEDYVKAIAGGSLEERLSMIQQQVMSRTALSRVIEEFQLYQADIRREGLESIIERMRKTIKVETVGTHGARGRSVEAFSLSFAHEDPRTAMQVTAKLASQFIEENLKVREQLVEGVSAFIEQELHAAKAALEAQEQAISQFKTRHMGVLPQQMEANLHALDRLQADLTATDELMHSRIDQLNLVEKSIKEYEASGTTHAGPGLPTAHAGVDPLVARLRELERNLTTLSAEYKETYPDIGQVKQEIEGVKAQLAAKYGDPAEEKDAEAAKTFDPYLRELVKQRNELRVEVGSMKDRRRRLAAQIKEFEHRVEQTPSREQELMILIRDYDNKQKNYQSLLDKRLNANIAGNLEKRQKGEQFRVLDPANLPTRPEKPNRLLIMGIGLLLGCGIGYGSAFALEQLSLPFRRPEEVESVLGLPVFATIPDFQMAYASGSAKSLPSRFLPRTESSSSSPSPPRALPDKTRAKAAGLGDQLLPRRKYSDGNGKLTSRGTNAEAVRQELNLVTRWKPQSMVAEQFRVAATRMALMGSTRTNTVVLVTSAVREEGKSATASNLGYVLAQDMNKATLLIDCDFKRPVLHTYTGVASIPGVVEALRRNQPLDSCLHRLGESSLWILPAGNRENWTHTLSNIHQLADVLTELRTRFEYIILDAPPILPLADTNLLAPLADLLVVVIRSGRTMQEVVRRALHAIKPTSQAGIILTGHGVDHLPYYMSYDYQMRALEGRVHDQNLQ